MSKGSGEGTQGLSKLFVWLVSYSLAGEIELMPESEELVSVCSAKLMEAHIIKGRLESEGIPAFLSYESAGLVFGISVDGLVEERVLVPKFYVKEAKRILGISAVNGRGTSR